MSKEVAVKKPSALMATMAERFQVPEAEMLATLKQTAFRQKDGDVSDAQMTALLIVANQYGLNPWTKEIYAFPDKNNGIVPVVGVDGWSRIINENPNLDGIEFRQSETIAEPQGGKPCPEWIECVIHRKDRSKPIVVREYLDEVYRPPFTGRKDGREYSVNGPWQSHTKRFLRHKALIQCSRLAFGFVGIYDEDEADRIVEKDITPPKPAVVMPQAKTEPKPEREPQVVEGEFIPAKPEAVDTQTGEIKQESVGVLASANQLKVLRGRLQVANLTEQDLCDEFFLENLEQLTANTVAPASAWIKKNAKVQA